MASRERKDGRPAGRGAWRPNEPGEAIFSLGRGSAERRLVPILRAAATLRGSPPESRQVVYYDTFDGRLQGAGLRLSSHEEDGLTALCLQRASGPGDSDEDSSARRKRARGGEGRHRTAFAHVDKIPSFASDLPKGRLRKRLARITDVRRLLPIVRIELSQRCYRVLDDEHKTVVKLCFERAVARDPEAPGDPVEIPATLRVVPIAGYRKAHTAMLERLGAQPGIEPLTGDLANRALAAIGREIVVQRSGLGSDLDAEAPAGTAFLTLHRELFATIRANERGIREDLDTEHVHDFRVAVRRTRNLHRVFRKLISGTGFEALLPGFKWLGKVTNPTRDLDVHLLEVRAQIAERPDERDALLPLAAVLREKRRAAWEQLVEALDSVPWAELETRAAVLLDPPTEGDAARVAGSGPPLGPWASEKIARARRRLAKHGRRIADDTPDDKLHDLRLDAKRLRYLLEFFSSLYTAAEFDPLLKSIKRLQQNLGHFNDARVQSGTLRALARELDARGVHGEALLAVGRLVERAEQRRDAERARFHECFRRFDSRANRKRFRRLRTAAARGHAGPTAEPRPRSPEAAPAPENGA